MKRNYPGFDEMFDMLREMEGFFPTTRRPFWRDLKETALLPSMLPQKMLPARELNVFLPAVECFTRDKDLVLKAELPGVDPAGIEISVVGDQLFLRGEKKEEKKVDEKDLFFKETTFGRFERMFTLPEGVKADNVKATMINGILEVTMPAGVTLTSAKVPIQIGEMARKTVKAA